MITPGYACAILCPGVKRLVFIADKDSSVEEVYPYRNKIMISGHGSTVFLDGDCLMKILEQDAYDEIPPLINVSLKMLLNAQKAIRNE